MGHIQKIIGADYSANNVGIFDFKTNVFRKKTDNGYERNTIQQQNSFCYGNNHIDLLRKIKVVIDWIPTEQRGGVLFSLTDWKHARTIFVKAHYSNSLHVAMYDCKSNIYANGIYRFKQYDDAGVVGEHNILTIIFDFDNWVIESVSNSAKELTLTTSASIDAQPTPFVNGQEPFSTFAVGQWSANYKDYQTRGFGKLSSVYVENMIDKLCLLNLDFCGDTEMERLTEKSHLYQLFSMGVTWGKDDVVL